LNGEPFVKLRNITERFGGLKALGGASLDVHPGEKAYPVESGSARCSVAIGRWGRPLGN
jgi:hypothetical protein